MPESVRDTEYEYLCHDCQDELDLDRPQFHGQQISKGAWEDRYCGRCEVNIDL